MNQLNYITYIRKNTLSSLKEDEERSPGMESVFSGSVLDLKKCNMLSLEEKRKHIHEIARNSKDASEILCAFTRRELLEVLCCEMGKERKYTGYSKPQMIEHLLKLISQNSNKRSCDDSPSGIQTQRKKQRNVEEPVFDQEEPAKFRLCDNVACRANLSFEETFCKRCSCCICHRYDDNKDPSLWWSCGSDTVTENDSCGMSCHLECALKHKRSMFSKERCPSKLDGSFVCVYCGKVNDSTRTWKKQLVVAKEARRVDILCRRLSLCHKILSGTEQNKEVQKMVESAVKMLSKEVGPLDRVAEMSRGIVNRLSCGTEVQKICSSALESFDANFLSPDRDNVRKREPIICKVQLEDLSSSSVTIVLQYDDDLLNGVLGCKLWHRRSDAKEYPEQPSFIVFKPEKRFKITDLHPSTAYLCKVCLIDGRGIRGISEVKWKTLDGQNQSSSESTNSSDVKLASEDNPGKLRVLDMANKQKSVALLPPCTPCKSDRERNTPLLPCSKRSEETDYEFSVRVIKWLENEGHVDGDFRVKFLTWFSLKATKQERKVVSVFVDIFSDDPLSLAGQLVHTFLGKICCEQRTVSQNVICTKFRYRI